MAHEAAGDPLHGRLSDANRRLAERLRDLGGDFSTLRRAVLRARIRRLVAENDVR